MSKRKLHECMIGSFCIVWSPEFVLKKDILGLFFLYFRLFNPVESFKVV